MKKKMRFLFVTLMMLSFLAGFALVSEAANLVNLPISVKEDYGKVQDMLTLINNHRLDLGLEKYSLSPSITEYAMQRAAECALQFDHFRPDGSLSAQDGLDEDIAAGSGTAQQTFNNWMSDYGHRRVIEDDEYKYCGIGCCYYDGTIYWVLNATEAEYNIEGASNIPSGTKNRQRTIVWDAGSAMGFSFYYSGTTIYYGDRSGIFSGTIRIRDPYQAITHNPGLGCSIPADLVSLYVADPSVARFDTSSGLIKPIGLKTGSTTVKISLKAYPSVTTTINLTVVPQRGSTNKEGKAYSFNYVLEKSVYAYTGSPIEPKMSIATDWFGRAMEEGKDYRLEYSGNTEPGTASVKIYHMNNYSSGSDIYFGKREFLISGQPAGPTAPDTPEVKPDPGNAPGTTPAPGGTPETPPAPETTPEVKPGPEAKPEVKPAPETKPEVKPAPETTPEVKPTPNAPDQAGQPDQQPQAKVLTVKLSKSELTYTGKALKPKVTVYYNGKKLAKKYYTVTYKNNKKPGSATVTVKGKGKYDGCSAKAAFTIKPKTVSLSSVKSSEKKKATVKWKKVGAVTGYQIQYSKNSKFTSGNKAETVSGVSRTSVTLTGLKSRKTYYVRIRAYRVSGGKNYYGSWSKTKKVTVK